MIDEEQIIRRKRRARRAKRRRRERRRRLIFCIMVAGILIWGAKMSQTEDRIYVKQDVTELVKPHLCEGIELQEELEELAHRDKEYKKVYEQREEYPVNVLQALCSNPEMISVAEHYLENGHPIICSMDSGDFTYAGHFIVLTGIKDGKIMVNDPNSRQRSAILWDYETLETQIKNLWAFMPI